MNIYVFPKELETRKKPSLDSSVMKPNAILYASNPEALLSFAMEACKIQFQLVDDTIDFDAVSRNIESQLDASFGPGYKIEFYDADLDLELEGLYEVSEVAYTTIKLILTRYFDLESDIRQ